VLGQYDLDFCEKYISHILLPARRTFVPISLRVGGRYTKQFIAYFPTDISFDKLPDNLTKEGSNIVMRLGSEEVNEKVGNKKSMKDRKVYPIWLTWQSSDFLYCYLPHYIAKVASSCGIYYWWSLYDYILDYVYSKPPSYWHAINNPESYIKAFVKRLIQSRLTRLDSFNQIILLGGGNEIHP